MPSADKRCLKRTATVKGKIINLCIDVLPPPLYNNFKDEGAMNRKGRPHPVRWFLHTGRRRNRDLTAEKSGRSTVSDGDKAMLKKAIARFKTFLSFTAPDSYRDELTDYLNAINVARAKLTSFVFIICEIVLLTGSLIAKRDELFAPPRQHYIWMYLLMLLCMAGFFLLFKQIQEGIPGNRTKIRIAGILFTGFILFWCAGISLMDQLSGGQILVYIFAMIAVSVTPIFEPFISFIIYAPPQIFFTALSMLNSPGAAPQFGNMMNSTTFVGISWAISCMRYKTHVMEFNNSKLIEQKNAELKKMNAMLQEANRKLDRLSKTDGLTGISNRAVFDFMINMEWERCKRQFKPLSLIMIDIDFFKNYNDTFGHVAGDKWWPESFPPAPNALPIPLRATAAKNLR